MISRLSVAAILLSGCSLLTFTDVGELGAHPDAVVFDGGDADAPVTADADAPTDGSAMDVDAGIVGGETCEAALTLSFGVATPGDTSSYANDVSPSCASTGTPVPDVFYRLDVASRGDLSLSTFGSAFDTVLLLATGCASFSPLACANDANASATTRLIYRRLEAGTYYVALDGDGATSTGAYELTAELGSDVVERGCANALDVTGGAAVWGETQGEDRFQPSALCNHDDGAPEEVFTFTLDQRTGVRIDTTESAFDTLIYLRHRSCHSGTEIACNDDESEGIIRSSRIDTDLNPGTYFLFLDGYNEEAQGAYRLNVYFDAPYP